jgi:SNF2 family DNA or RNA helicase
VRTKIRPPSTTINHPQPSNQVLDRLLPKLQAAGHRCVIFSQFTTVLDILDDYLNFKEIKFCRLDGGTNRVQRTVCCRHRHPTNHTTILTQL